MSLLEQRHDVLHHIVEIRRHWVRTWHSRIARELVHEVPNSLDLTHDCVRALKHNRLVTIVSLFVTTTQSLCAQLNRSEWVLNLMRDSTRHFLPRRHPLRTDELRQVIQQQHRP